MKKYDVDVEVTQRYTITVEAEAPEKAAEIVEGMTGEEIDADLESQYIDTSTEILEVTDNED